MEMSFCRRCGTPLEPGHEGSYTCQNGHSLFSNAAPTVGVFLLDSDHNVILSVRGIEPRKGRLDSFGGFVDVGETFEQALIRELREETGLEPGDYTAPVYLTSGTATYPYDGEIRDVLSAFYYATLRDGTKVQALDDVGAILTAPPKEINLADFGDSDSKDGFIALRKVLS